MISEAQRQAWNAAVTTHNAEPTPATAAALAALKTELLTAIFAPHVEELTAKQTRPARPPTRKDTT